MSKKIAHEIRQNLRKQSIDALTTDNSRIKHILEYGIFAPSTHNTQPWKLKIEHDSVHIFADFSKKIPQADPKGRDLYMSLGALIRNIELAAAAYGVKTDLQIENSLEQKEFVASIVFSGLENADVVDQSILTAILERQNYRGFFTDQLDKDSVAHITKTSSKGVAQAVLFTNKQLIQDIANLTATGLKMAYATPSFRREIASYISHNLSRKRHGLHGYSLRMNLPTSLIIPKIMKRKDIGAKLAAKNYESFISAPALIVLSSTDDERGWLQAGMVLENIMIELTKIGLSGSIFAAAIEMGDLRSQLAGLTGFKDPKRPPQIIFCVGKPASKMPHSVRKKLDNFLIS